MRQPPFKIPADVADTAQLHRYLADGSVFDDPREAEGYLSDSIDRFRVTMAVLDRVAPDSRCLELGSNPYFLTRLLRRRGIEVTCANYFGPHHPEASGSQAITRADGGVEGFDYDHFNVESAAFPYADSSFDLVLFCEILEHLPADPVNALGEIHRVLKKETGMVLTTTPNAARAGNVGRILAGENPYEALSGYGAYGRHNREYTLVEMRRLLAANGFEVVEAFTADVHAHDDHSMPEAPFIKPSDRADSLFCLARAAGADRWVYPDWLFTSKHGLYGRRVVRDGVRVGVNDDLQTTGLHPLEEGPQGPFRWMGEGAVKVLTRGIGGGKGSLVVEGFAPQLGAGEMPELLCTLGTTTRSWKPTVKGAFRSEFEFDVPAGTHEISLSVSSTWCPADIGRGPDQRRLGLALTGVYWAVGDPG
jgi:SAM-dependent methyltransferase